MQSGSPSHFQLLRMHLPFERHLNSSSGHGISQCCSSEPSPQSSIPSQIVADGVQLLFLHWNVPVRHWRGGQVAGSSEPSLQSCSPSHLENSMNNDVVKTNFCFYLYSATNKLSGHCIFRRGLFVGKDKTSLSKS